MKITTPQLLVWTIGVLAIGNVMSLMVLFGRLSTTPSDVRRAVGELSIQLHDMDKKIDTLLDKCEIGQVHTEAVDVAVQGLYADRWRRDEARKLWTDCKCQWDLLMDQLAERIGGFVRVPFVEFPD